MNETQTQQSTPQPVRQSLPERWVILCLLGVFLFGLPGLLALPAEAVLFNPDAYKAQLRRMEVYERYPEILGTTLADGSDILLSGAGENLLSVLQKGNYPDFLRLLFPEGWIRSQAESLVDQFFAFMNFETPQLALVVDFRPVVQQLQAEQDLALVQTLVKGLPECSTDDLTMFGLLALRGTFGEVPVCRPPDQLAGIMNEVITTGLRGAALLAPEQIDLADALRFPAFLAGESGAEGVPGRAFQTYRLLRTAAPWLGLLGLISLGSAVWLARRTARGPLFWGGVGLILPGFAALLIALILAMGSNQIAPLALANLFFADLPVFDLLTRLFQAVVNRYLLWVGGIGLALTLVGAALVGWVVRQERAKVKVRAA
jgi:hypothetical protein